MEQEIEPIISRYINTYLSDDAPEDESGIECLRKYIDDLVLNSSDSTEGPFGTITPVEGGVTAAAGFRATGVHAGFRDDPKRLDFALVLADEPCAAAATFTQNVFCAAPVRVSRAHLSGLSVRSAEESRILFQFGTARALIINSGNANAATGAVGLETAEQSAQIAADEIGCTTNEVLTASTGVIGVQLPLEPFKEGVPKALKEASNTPESAHKAAEAIMTTDTVSKEVAYSFTVDAPEYEGITFTVGGMAKGSGMIMPNMATMISVVTTDVPITNGLVGHALGLAVNDSFNKVTVDSDTSTNDSCFIFASGKAARNIPDFTPAKDAGEAANKAYFQFCYALRMVCNKLARQMATDGEGATKLVTVHVFGAANDEDADKVARTIANSPLVKTAIYGHDCNWGRIVAAAGRSGARFSQDKVDIDIMGLPVCRGGLAIEFDEEEALKLFEDKEIIIDIDLHAGNSYTRMWTCDFTHDYITINGDYRT